MESTPSVRLAPQQVGSFFWSVGTAILRPPEPGILPAAKTGDTETMTTLLSGPLTNLFEQHRREILELVALADNQRQRIEQSASSVYEDRTYFLGIFGLCVSHA